MDLTQYRNYIAYIREDDIEEYPEMVLKMQLQGIFMLAIDTDEIISKFFPEQWTRGTVYLVPIQKGHTNLM